MVKVSASVLTADLSALGGEIGRVRSAGADMLHIDVMDGVFVPPMTVGDVVVRSLSRSLRETGTESLCGAKIPFDVHLMVNRPEPVIPLFADAGSDYITIHAESDCDIPRCLNLIRSLGKKAGIAINPPTPAESVLQYAGLADLFVVMSVNPGYGGQAFMPEVLPKIAALRAELGRRDDKAAILVDGGINEKTAPLAVQAGADILVAGAYLFNAPDMTAAVETLRQGLRRGSAPDPA